MRQENFAVKIAIPEGVQISNNDAIYTVKGPKGEVKKKLNSPILNITIKNNEVIISATNANKRHKMIAHTFRAHFNNMIKGVQEGFTYKLKICASHFPMNVSFNNKKFAVKNFLGEKIPRELDLSRYDNINVNLDGEFITIESPDKEQAGQASASIEQLCRITNKDRRVFADGIWITMKANKEI